MSLFFYLAVAALFMLTTGFRLFAEGMFVDGVTYAAISRNLSNGIGTFWEPQLSATLYSQFHEHPPLGIGLQGLAFRIFGDSLLVERFYSLGTFLLTGLLVVLIWKELTGEKKTGWIPLFFWILFPMISWAAASNLLDNTLEIFTTLAILLILKNSRSGKPAFLILAGFSVFAGLLTKGPFALFPLVLPFLLPFERQVFSLKTAVANTIVPILSCLIPLALLISLSTEARESLHTYWMNQVVGSIQEVKTVSNRFYILSTLLSQLIVPIAAAGAILLIFRRQADKEKLRPYLRPGLILMVLGLSGVLPIMISLKQSSFYLLAALPAFALMIALPVWVLLSGRIELLNPKKTGARAFRYATILIFAVSMVVPPLAARQNRRDRDKLAVVHDFSLSIPAGSTILINPVLFSDWSLQSYFARHSRISLDPHENPDACFYLSSVIEWPPDSIALHWTRARELNGYVLFKK
jgi:4-amino-4-deoxy-L-arabinose transferase-like glycosyltransferase